MENPFRHKIVIFGSSFTHGVSTSRAGMSYPMQIGRNTGLYFCSIACSGNCKLQPYFADYLGDVKDADAMVFDAFSNPDAKMIEERLIPFIERIRAKLPSTPLMSCRRSTARAAISTSVPAKSKRTSATWPVGRWPKP